MSRLNEIAQTLDHNSVSGSDLIYGEKTTNLSDFKITLQEISYFVQSGLLDYRGDFDASGNVFPSTGGSGTSEAIWKSDTWYISVAGTLGDKAVQIGDTLISKIDNPGQTASNWSILNTNIGFVPENPANKNQANGYLGIDSNGKIHAEDGSQLTNITATQVGALAVISTQAEFNACIERTSANNYKFKDTITSVYIKAGNYDCYSGSSFLSGGDTWAHVVTNLCASLVCERGTVWLIGDTTFSISGNESGIASDCLIKRVTLKGLGVSNIIDNSSPFFGVGINCTFQDCSLSTVKIFSSSGYSIFGVSEGGDIKSSITNFTFVNVTLTGGTIYGFTGVLNINKIFGQITITGGSFTIWAASNNIEEVYLAIINNTFPVIIFDTCNNANNIMIQGGTKVIGSSLAFSSNNINNCYIQHTDKALNNCTGINNIKIFDCNYGVYQCKGVGHGINITTATIQKFFESYADVAGTTYLLDSITGLPIASASNSGLLSTADWNTFYGKQAPLGFTPENIANKNTVNGYMPNVRLGISHLVDVIKNGTDTLHAIDISAGIKMFDSTGTKILTSVAMTKRGNVAWSSGNNNGGDSQWNSYPWDVNSTHHLFMIEKDSDLSIDYCWDTSITASHRPNGYTKYVRIWSNIADVFGSILQFKQIGNKCLWNSRQRITPFASAVDAQAHLFNVLGIPYGLYVNGFFSITGYSGISTQRLIITSPLAGDELPGQGNATVLSVDDGSNEWTQDTLVIPNTTQQLRYSYDDTTAINIACATIYYEDITL